MAKRYRLKSRPKSYVERKKNGQFKNWVGIGKSLSADRRQQAKRSVKSGYGHRGDIRRTGSVLNVKPTGIRIKKRNLR